MSVVTTNYRRNVMLKLFQHPHINETLKQAFD